MARPKRSIPKGIPKNLEGLARAGERYRFAGFWLNDSEADRAIAGWIDEQSNAAAIIKSLIFRLATGRAIMVSSEALAAGYLMPGAPEADPIFEHEHEIVTPFDEFDD